MIVGPSGSGKSSLALELMSMDAILVADDKTIVRRQDQILLVTPPEATAGLIEARQVGLLRAEHCKSAQLTLVVDLSREESERLPPYRTHSLMGLDVDLILGAKNPHIGAAVLQYLKFGRSA